MESNESVEEEVVDFDEAAFNRCVAGLDDSATREAAVDELIELLRCTPLDDDAHLLAEPFVVEQAMQGPSLYFADSLPLPAPHTHTLFTRVTQLLSEETRSRIVGRLLRLMEYTSPLQRCHQPMDDGTYVFFGVAVHVTQEVMKDLIVAVIATAERYATDDYAAGEALELLRMLSEFNWDDLEVPDLAVTLSRVLRHVFDVNETDWTLRERVCHAAHEIRAALAEFSSSDMYYFTSRVLTSGTSSYQNTLSVLNRLTVIVLRMSDDGMKELGLRPCDPEATSLLGFVHSPADILAVAMAALTRFDDVHMHRGVCFTLHALRRAARRQKAVLVEAQLCVTAREAGVAQSLLVTLGDPDPEDPEEDSFHEMFREWLGWLFGEA